MKLLLALVMCIASGQIFAEEIKIMPITPEQKGALAKAFPKSTGNSATDKALAEARESISDFLEIESCIAGYNATPLNKYAAPGTTFPAFNYTGGMFGMAMYRHDKRTCATVSKIQGVQMRTKNALRLESLFVADDSGETAKREFTFERQPSGQWLVTWP